MKSARFGSGVIIPKGTLRVLWLNRQGGWITCYFNYYEHCADNRWTINFKLEVSVLWLTFFVFRSWYFIGCGRRYSNGGGSVTSGSVHELRGHLRYRGRHRRGHRGRSQSVQHAGRTCCFRSSSTFQCRHPPTPPASQECLHCPNLSKQLFILL